jgi:hypothetical protein
MSGKHIEKLRHLVQFPTAQKWPHPGELLVSGRGHRMMGSF